MFLYIFIHRAERNKSAPTTSSASFIHIAHQISIPRPTWSRQERTSSTNLLEQSAVTGIEIKIESATGTASEKKDGRAGTTQIEILDSMIGVGIGRATDAIDTDPNRPARQADAREAKNESESDTESDGETAVESGMAAATARSASGDVVMMSGMTIKRKGAETGTPGAS